MTLDPRDFTQIPENRHDVQAGSLLFATETPITLGGGTSRAFVKDQGGDDSTFVFLLGQRQARGPLGIPVTFVEGVFLLENGRGFHPTWGLEQLLREIDAGGWRVVTTPEVLGNWTGKVEARMNRGDVV